jgi:glycine hydroxymethyltransferase
MVPGGLRMGSPALTSRGFVEADFEQVAEFVHRGVAIAQTLKKAPGLAKLKDFRESLLASVPPELQALRGEVEDFAKQFPTIGFEKSSMRYKE